MAKIAACDRVRPPAAGTEKEMLAAFLDWQRATLRCKLAGLSDDELRRPHDPSGLTLLGLVKHIAAVERHWFRRTFAGEDVPNLWTEEWRFEPGETMASIFALADDEAAKSRAIVAAASLDDIAANARGKRAGVTLRWIAFHMVEEMARHTGHADLIREAIDGAVGE